MNIQTNRLINSLAKQVIHLEQPIHVLAICSGEIGRASCRERG